MEQALLAQPSETAKRAAATRLQAGSAGALENAGDYTADNAGEDHARTNCARLEHRSSDFLIRFHLFFGYVKFREFVFQLCDSHFQRFLSTFFGHRLFPFHVFGSQSQATPRHDRSQGK